MKESQITEGIQKGDKTVFKVMLRGRVFSGDVDFIDNVEKMYFFQF